MELRQIEYFLEVAESGSVTSAAKHFHIAQPSVSQALRRLEREVGTPLFERVNRGMRLTCAGEALVVPARRMLRERAEARAAVNAVVGLDGGHIDLIGVPSLITDPVAGFVGTFLRRHPKVRFNIGKTTDPLEVAVAVDEGRADLGFSDLVRDDQTSLSYHPLCQQKFLIALPAGIRDAESPLTIAELASLRFVVGPAGGSSRMALETLLSAKGHSLEISVETMTTDAVVPLVAAGAGSALLPQSLAKLASTMGADVFELETDSAPRQVFLVQRTDTRSPLTTAFIDWCVDGRAVHLQS